MKRFVTLTLALFFATVGFLTAHNVFDHEDEPKAILPTGPSITPTTRPIQHANVTLTMGASAMANVADGRREAGKLVATNGTGSAKVDPDQRRVELRATSAQPSGRSIWFAIVGSDLTIHPGTTTRANAIIRVDGITWHGTLHSDGGTAKADISLEVQDQAGHVLATTPIASATLDTVGSQIFDGPGQSATAQVTVQTDQSPAQTTTLRAYLFVNVAATGGSGATAVDLAASPTSPNGGVSFDAVAVAIGAAPPPTTAPPPGPVPGQGITMAQLSQHSTTASCWLLISGRVYDVTAFLPHHPGRGSTMAKYCGKDATQGFLTQDGRGSRHSYAAIDKMKKLYIGDFAG